MTNKRKSTIKMAGLVCCGLFAAAAIFASAFPDTLAWFLQEKNSDKLEFKSGKLHYVLDYTPKPVLDSEGNPVIDRIIVPGELLLDSFSLTNFSTIESDIRFKILYTGYDNEADIIPEDVLHTVAQGKLEASIEPTFTWDSKEFWEHEESVAPNEQEAGTVLPVFSDPLILRYSGERAGNEFNGVPAITTVDGETKTTYTAKPISVIISFQMKQSDALKWEDAFVIKITNEEQP